MAALYPAAGVTGGREAVMALWWWIAACAAAPGDRLEGKRDGADAARAQLPVVLTAVRDAGDDVVDLQFPPGSSDVAVAVEQAGVATWLALDGTRAAPLVRLPVAHGGEKGLLGLAFHPDFATNGRIFVDATFDDGGRLVSRIVELHASGLWGEATVVRTIYEVAQPYANHNAGQLAFGPDGKLYVGFGDGGSGGDPQKNGQNPGVPLGKILRLDVDAGAPYAAPADNPRLPGWLPELYALGVRNPWRFSFDPAGRLVIGDVGQNTWEEVTFAPSGANCGWNTREASHCFPPEASCDAAGFVDPIWEYPHDQGVSVTGGYVATAPGPLAGKYVFGDFGSGRLWALTLPATGQRAEPAALGRFGIHPSTFGRGADGRVYVVDYGPGVIWRIDAL